MRVWEEMGIMKVRVIIRKGWRVLDIRMFGGIVRGIVVGWVVVKRVVIVGGVGCIGVWV